MSGAAPLDLPLHVDTRGREAGPGVDTFLLLHGYGASSFSWRHWTPFLSERGHVLVVDMKGFGSAPHPDDARLGPRDQAELIVHLIRQRRLERLTLVGHSLGGGVALLTALLLGERAEHRRRLQRLVVVAGAAYRQRLPPFVALARWPRLTRALLAVVGARALIGCVLRSIVHDRRSVTRGQVEGYADPLGSPESVRSLAAAAARIVPPDLDDLVARYPSLDVPTLLLWGRNDRVVPLAIGERLARDLPRARLEVLEGCGHLPAEERVDGSLACLAAFLDGDPPVTRGVRRG